MKKNTLYIIIALELVLLAGSGITIAWLWDHWFLSGPHGSYRWIGMDFIPFWVGGREMLTGSTPYSASTMLQTQQLAYGGPAINLDPLMFGYPAWILLIITPFAALPLKWAVVSLESLLITGLLNFYYFLSCQWAKHNLRGRMLWMSLLVMGGLPFVIISITRGQLGYLGLFALLITSRLWDRRPFLAGIILSLAIVKPTVTLVPTLCILFWALYEKNWSYLLGFATSMLVLVGSSMAAIGNWLPDYVNVLSMAGGLEPIWSLKILSIPWNILYASIFVILLGFSFAKSRRTKNRKHWFSASILNGIALFPMHWIYDLYLGILIPSEEGSPSFIQTLFTGFALLSPWLLSALPESIRWHAATIVLPVAWVPVLLTILFDPEES